MLERGGQLAVSDAPSIQNGTVSIDGGHESGIGSDSDSNNDADPALTHTTELSLDAPAGRMTSTELLSDSDEEDNDWRRVAERYTSELPHDAVNVRLDDEFARFVIPPPPPPLHAAHDDEPEMNSSEPAVDAKRPSRRLPALPSNEPTVEQLADSAGASGLREEERCRAGDYEWLWRKAASVDHSHHQQTGSRNDDAAHARSAITSADAFGRDSTSPRSRDGRRPISDVAPASPAHQRTEDRVSASRDAMTSQSTMTSSQRQRSDVTETTFRPVERTYNRASEARDGIAARARTSEIAGAMQSRSLDAGDIDEEGRKLDRKWIESATDDRRRTSQANGDDSCDVIKPEVTSEHATSSGRERKQYAAEVGVAVGRPDMNIQQGDGPSSAAGGTTSTKLMERRRAGAGRGGRMTPEEQLSIMVDHLNRKQRQIQQAGSAAPPEEYDRAEPVGVQQYRGLKQNVSVEAGPRRQDVLVDSLMQSCPRLTNGGAEPPNMAAHSGPRKMAAASVTRRQLEYEAGLRKYGPNYRPDEPTNHDQRQPAVSTGQWG